MLRIESLSLAKGLWSSHDEASIVLGGIDNALFLQGLAGYLVIGAILIPILKWAFPTNKGVKAERELRKTLRREVREIKRKK